MPRALGANLQVCHSSSHTHTFIVHNVHVNKEFNQAPLCCCKPALHYIQEANSGPLGPHQVVNTSGTRHIQNTNENVEIFYCITNLQIQKHVQTMHRRR
jgi:hypothetical protein